MKNAIVCLLIYSQLDSWCDILQGMMPDGIGLRWFYWLDYLYNPTTIHTGEVILPLVFFINS